MSRLPVSPRALLALAGIVGLVALIEFTALSSWLTYAGYTGLLLVAPLAVVGVVLMGVWTGFKYVRDRGWQD